VDAESKTFRYCIEMQALIDCVAEHARVAAKNEVEPLARNTFQDVVTGAESMRAVIESFMKTRGW
jgi:hypothetical protein